MRVSLQLRKQRFEYVGMIRPCLLECAVLILSLKRFGQASCKEMHPLKVMTIFLFLLIHLEEVGKGIISGPMPMGQKERL